MAWMPDLKPRCPVTEAGFKHKKFAIHGWRADREGGDTKTRKSRRTLELPKLAAERSGSTTPARPPTSSGPASLATP
ncbi:hypothetical protein ACTMTF_35785 [Nonomuraea sp. ZG12]|uniref:hypothetical protein n=1 Tax=Nonomuraea sp. ZG12 TaxID=3452207 RepID=UPI003F8C793C